MNVLARLTRPLERLPGLGPDATPRESIIAGIVYIAALAGSALVLLAFLIWSGENDADPAVAEMTPTPEAAVSPVPTPALTPVPDPTPAASPEPGLTPTPASTPAPEATPTPALTPEAEPTPTPEMTPTPEPDPEVAEELSVEEYQEWLDDIRETLGSSLGHFSELRSEADVGDPEWESEVERELDIWRSLLESAEELDPPDELDDAHNMIISGLKEISTAADRVQMSLRNKDSADLEQGQHHIAVGLDLILRGATTVGESSNQD
jgi:hypothetical protein